jgi:hypothetical protein
VPHILLNCAEQCQGRHQYVAQEPGNPADVTIVLLVIIIIIIIIGRREKTEEEDKEEDKHKSV